MESNQPSQGRNRPRRRRQPGPPRERRAATVAAAEAVHPDDEITAIREPQGDRGRGWVRKANLEIHPAVFFFSAGSILLFVLFAVFNPDLADRTFTAIKGAIASKVGWFFVLTVNVILVFVVWLMLGRHGRITLGRPGEKPEFSTWAWFAMLFSAGMGIGLLFYSVAEPVLHYMNPPIGEGNGVEAARLAMAISFIHWGLHTWAIYALVGLTLAFFSFRKGLPLTIRSAFHPLIGDRVHGPIGNLIDIVAVVATLFGVATSLGLGVQQVNAGLNYLFDVSISVPVQILLIVGITLAATTSVVLGLDRGIRRLSQLNIVLALVLMVFVLVVGPTVFLLDGMVQNTGHYLQNLLELGTWTETYKGTDWQVDWTVFFWAWWIAWSPFVGMFIARVSRGRTIREFVAGVLLVPTLVTFVWFSIFGGTALFLELSSETSAVSAAVQDDVSTGMFALLHQYPLATFSSLLAVFVVIVFFITSSDSGSLVIDIITAGGHPDPPVVQRIFWAVLEGVVAAVLLVVGGLQALQTASITTGLPFAVILLLMCFGLNKGLRSVSGGRGSGAPRQRAARDWDRDRDRDRSRDRNRGNRRDRDRDRGRERGGGRQQGAKGASS